MGVSDLGTGTVPVAVAAEHRGRTRPPAQGPGQASADGYDNTVDLKNETPALTADRTHVLTVAGGLLLVWLLRTLILGRI